ncbi:MAG: Ig-like domain-containing protein [bacterium]
MMITTKDRLTIFGIILFISVMASSMAFAGSATVTWDANTESDLAGYKIYYGTVSQNYSQIIDVGNLTSHQISNLQGGQTYYFAVKAYDVAGNESAFSNEVSAFINSANTDTNAPELVAVVPRGETQIDVMFSESVSKASAENASNYSISNGVQVLGAILDADEKTVHLITSAYNRGQEYTLSISHVEDLSGNVIAAGTAQNFSLPNPNSDSTPPSIIYAVAVDESHVDVVFNEALDPNSANRASNYSINNSVRVTGAQLKDNQSIVQLTTSAHSANTSHTLTVSGVKDVAGNAIQNNNTYTYKWESGNNNSDTTPPQLISVSKKGLTQIDINFSEPVEKSSSENINNYSITNNIEIIGAVRDANLTTVHLLTSTHQNGVDYTVTVINVEDFSGNKITSNNQLSYKFTTNDPPPGDGPLPESFSLFQNYPNPFNPETEIRFFLDEKRKVELNIYNPLGQLVRSLVNDELNRGLHSFIWDGTNKHGKQVPTGVYIYSLEVSQNIVNGNILVNLSRERRVRKMTLIR